MASRDALWTIGSLSLAGVHLEARWPPGAEPPADQAAAALLRELVRALAGLVAPGADAPSELLAALRVDGLSAERIGGSDGSYVERVELRGAMLTLGAPPTDASNAREQATLDLDDLVVRPVVGRRARRRPPPAPAGDARRAPRAEPRRALG
ncbi:MAG: hypothetical protein U1F43_11480 [Myxococcota bacterium]